LGVELKLDIKTPDDIEVECRPINISQILLNLLNNALDAVTDTPTKWVRLSLTQEGEDLCFRVTDSGNPIPKDVSDKLMNPFFSTKQTGKGVGLGLSICLALAKQHQGSLELEGGTE